MKYKFLQLTIMLLLALFTAQAQEWASLEIQTTGHSETSTSKIFLVLEITVHDSMMYEQYRIGVEPLIQKYGGKYLVRSGAKAFDNEPDTKIIPAEGDWAPDRLIITQWDSIEQLQAFAKSDEYQPILKLRKNSATTRSVIVKEYLRH